MKTRFPVPVKLSGRVKSARFWAGSPPLLAVHRETSNALLNLSLSYTSTLVTVPFPPARNHCAW